MGKLLVRAAADAFAQGNYVKALNLYNQAGDLIGHSYFKANISLCEARMKALTDTKSLTKITENKSDGNTIDLSISPLWQCHQVMPGQAIHAQAIIKVTNGNNKSSVALIRFCDKHGEPIDPTQIALPRSEILKSNFVYLPDSQVNPQEFLRIQVPHQATTVEIGFCLFAADKETTVQVTDLKINFIATKPVETNEKSVSLKKSSEFKVALIADEFTYNSFKDEFLAYPIEPETWLTMFEENKPDIFFCESAWSGPDPVRRPWKGKVYASKNFSWENRKELLKIINYCRVKGIPTIFWNKEDPTHYEDRVNDFVKTAIEFDHVFTSAAECVEQYKKDYGLKNVYALPFATNPRLFNPIVKTERTNKIIFAGSWYANHLDRCIVMESILDRLIEQGTDIEIYDRYYGSDDPNRQWPERFGILIKPNVPHDKMAEVYKSSYFGLNFNTVTESTTMFARRVFELMSCNTLVISNYSVGIEQMFGSLVIFADRDIERFKELTSQKINELREASLNLVLREHTYGRRWKQILDHAGINYLKHDETITMMCLVRSHSEALSGITWHQKQSGLLQKSNLLLVVDDCVSEIDIAQFYENYNRLGVSVTSISHAKKYALDEKYKPIETNYFLLINPAQSISQEWIMQAIPHLQYMRTHLLSPAATDAEKYSIGEFKQTSFCLGRKESAAELLISACKPNNIYFV